jgi:hypothetical protein
MQEHQELHAMHEVIDLIEEELEKAEDHLECAMKLGSAHVDHPMHIKHGEQSLKDAEEWMQHKHGHVQQMKGSDHAHHKVVCDLWHHRHPELMKDHAEVKYMFHNYKGGKQNGGNW